MIGSSKVLVTAVLLSLVSGAGAGAFVSVRVSVPQQDIGQAVSAAMIRYEEERRTRELTEELEQEERAAAEFQRQMKGFGKCDDCRATIPWGEKQ